MDDGPRDSVPGRIVPGNRAKVPPLGTRFGRLTFLGIESAGGAGVGVIGRFRCDCGSDAVVRLRHARKGHAVSCGCFHRQRQREFATKHGEHGTPEYKSWQSMKTRCLNPAAREFKYWGGRGIKICDRWIESFAAFRADMGPRPPGKTIDRYPDKDGNYEPGNCRWATPVEQAANRRPKGGRHAG